MDVDEALAGISTSEQQRLVKRAFWSLPFFAFAALSAVAAVVVLFTDPSLFISTVVATVVYGGVFLWIMPSVSGHGDVALQAVYTIAIKKCFSGVGRVVVGVFVLVLVVMAYNRLDTVGDKVGETYDSAAEFIAEQLEPEPEPAPVVAAGPTEAEKLQQQRLELEQERLQFERDKRSQASAAASVASEPDQQSVVETPAPQPIDSAPDEQYETEIAVSKAANWLVPYLDNIVAQVEYEQFSSTNSQKWIAASTYSANVYTIDSMNIGVEQTKYRETDDSDRLSNMSAVINLSRLQKAEIKCSEYDVRPRHCNMNLWAKRGFRFDGNMASCNNNGCYVQLFFYERDMDTAQRIRNAFDDIIDLMGNREPY